jgi:hypothetical protein
MTELHMHQRNTYTLPEGPACEIAKTQMAPQVFEW